jgi:hypothetical protein
VPPVKIKRARRMVILQAPAAIRRRPSPIARRARRA